jgi:hypothetical protein
LGLHFATAVTGASATLRKVVFPVTVTVVPRTCRWASRITIGAPPVSRASCSAMTVPVAELASIVHVVPLRGRRDETFGDDIGVLRESSADRGTAQRRMVMAA